jgi:hypothetical protein
MKRARASTDSQGPPRAFPAAGAAAADFSFGFAAPADDEGGGGGGGGAGSGGGSAAAVATAAAAAAAVSTSPLYAPPGCSGAYAVVTRTVVDASTDFRAAAGDVVAVNWAAAGAGSGGSRVRVRHAVLPPSQPTNPTAALAAAITAAAAAIIGAAAPPAKPGAESGTLPASALRFLVSYTDAHDATYVGGAAVHDCAVLTAFDSVRAAPSELAAALRLPRCLQYAPTPLALEDAGLAALVWPLDPLSAFGEREGLYALR